MNHKFQTLKYAVVTAIVTIGLAWGISIVVGDRPEEATLTIVRRIEVNAEQTRDLICDILAQAESDGVREAVALHCG